MEHVRSVTETWPRPEFEVAAVEFRPPSRCHHHHQCHPREVAPSDRYGLSVQSYNRASHSRPALSEGLLVWRAHCLGCSRRERRVEKPERGGFVYRFRIIQFTVMSSHVGTVSAKRGGRNTIVTICSFPLLVSSSYYENVSLYSS